MRNSRSLPKPQSTPALTDQVYTILREAILSLDLSPGEHLSIQQLSDQLGVSRTPVKDALVRLEQDGLVNIIPQKGTYVSEITAEDVEEILELRILLESYAASRAARNLSPDELEQAETIQKNMEKLHAEGKHFEAAITGNQLHQLLLSKTGNRRLISFLQQLDVQYARFRLYSAKFMPRTAQSITEHSHILEALRAKDADLAATAIRAHLSSVKEDILSSLFPQVKDKDLLAELGEGERN